MITFLELRMLRIRRLVVSCYAILAILVAFPAVLCVGVAFYDPTAAGGSMFVDASEGLTEPLNVIISGLSSPQVLSGSGLLRYAHALGFTDNCPYTFSSVGGRANLGDGNGYASEKVLMCKDHADRQHAPFVGTILHAYFQNGAVANSGAIFLSVANRDPHGIVTVNGYDAARDEFVKAATGLADFGGVTYLTVAQSIVEAMRAGVDDVNHGISVDGAAALLTVTIVETDDSL